MTLPVADIDRWSVQAMRTVFHAASARGQATLEASRQLSSLTVFDTWEGATAEARRHANAVIRQDLDAHGNESLAVAAAAGKAADGIEHVQSALRALRHDAAELQMTIDPMANKVVPSAAFNGPPIAALVAEMQLQPRLDAIVAQASAVDAELASAINLADEDLPIPPGPHDNRPPIQDALCAPLPDEPKQFNALWQRLTPEEKDWLYSRNHDIGNRAGMPWDPTDHLGKDHYNRLHLQELRQQAKADVDRMQHCVDEMLAGHNVDDGALYALQSQLAAARRRLQGYQAVLADLDRSDGLSRYLGYLDDTGHVAVAIGNPDYAKRNGIFVPGTGQDPARLPFSDARAAAMYNAARGADKALGPHDVSITTWMGYDRPMTLSHAAFPDPARTGAGRLEAFESGLRASHIGPPSIDTVIGHSYGSTLVGAAASGGHHLAADNVIAVGSPGMLVDRAGGLSLAPGAHVYAIRAANDIIGVSGVVTEWTLGPDPTAPNFGARSLAADPGPAGLAWLPSIDPHSSYWDQQNIALANMGAVIAAVAPPRILGPQ
ncbi:alpha/beta hydrolase [Candidatus Mycobacterium methanotrophicum]|uniref:Alpha/beta hydrolase family protein n=1 Tax=Candidatus Mycobacterium methanotrophicum TaxID=2943498 RepID=A0ABY4QIH7_9MYCO|nr:alpha/beta hydrolase [Candidatus Mycobacterium methanotrophicum]UQX10835.1 alpha/beta hydrolase family protein [Candidatus Mycobacterium methanotrophicum]